jgi:L-cysteine desulfidase
MDKESLLGVLREEIERSTGCTDPGAVCLAVSRAVRELSQRPERVVVTVSPNVYKNGVSVGVPGTGQRGLRIAAALGAVLDKSEAGLAILDYVTEEKLEEAMQQASTHAVQVRCAETPDPLYIKAQVWAGQDCAHVVIANDYSNITEIARNGVITFSSPEKKNEAVKSVLGRYSLKQLYDLVETMTVQDLEFLLAAAEVNRAAAEIGLSSVSLRLGLALNDRPSKLPEPFSAMNKAQVLTAAAGEARMSGLPVPVMAMAGSGNHGIANFLGILAVAETLSSSQEKLAKALAISSTVTVYIKSFVKRMTAFCGCSVAAATGVAAGTVFLLGGSYDDSVHAMQSVVGTLSGMLCDGAKESCAYKLSVSVAIAIQFAYLALQGAYVPAGMGIVGNTIEDTIENLGLLNNPGMVETDRFLLKLIEKTQAG